MASGLTTGFMLDRQWHWLRGEMETTKKPALMALARLLHESHVAYAIIDGIAVQVHHPDPRTTIDIDVAVTTLGDLPREEMLATGFRAGGTFEHSENWTAFDGTPVQFTDDPPLATAIAAAGEIVLDGVVLRVIRAIDLLHEKIRSGS